MSILDRIITDKKIEVAKRKSLFPSSYWRPPRSLNENLIPLQLVYDPVLQELLQNTKDVRLPDKTLTVPFL